MATSSSERIKFTKQQLFDLICKTCCYPDNPKEACTLLRRGDSNTQCKKNTSIGRATCKKTSLENESIFENY
jgi:hypothetical protein